MCGFSRFLCVEVRCVLPGSNLVALDHRSGVSYPPDVSYPPLPDGSVTCLRATRIIRSLLAVLVLLLALFFRTYRLDRVPPGLDGDEMFNGWDALRVWEGNVHVYFPANYGREPSLIYLMALATRLVGVGAWTLRLPSALCGVLGLALTWSLARRLFNVRVAALTTALTSVSLWPVLLNRVALRAGLQPVCQVAAVYALWRALDFGVDQGQTWAPRLPGAMASRSLRGWAAVAGLFVGLTFYTYTAGRLFPAFLILWLLLVWILSRHVGEGWRFWRVNGRQLALMCLVAGLVVLPLGLFALRHPETFNQRVQELDIKLRQLRTGNLDPIWRSIKDTLGMFTQRGDWDWRYNPAGRPVFDQLTGLLFYLGLLVSLSRAGRPAYSLLLVWLPVMLLPTVLSIGTPSFWHSVGALTPIYLMPAIGVDFVGEQVARWLRRFDRRRLVTGFVLPLIVVVGLVFVAADTWQDYFGAWARHPEILDVFEADLAAAARYLNGYARAEDGTATSSSPRTPTPVWISSNYPSDLSRMVLRLQSDYPGPIRWFDGNQVTVWPSGWAGQDVLLLFTRSSPPNPDALAVLEDYLIYNENENENDPAGRPHLWVYRVPGDVLSRVPWHFAHTLSGRFAYNREMLGYDVPEQVQRGTEVPVVVYWRVPPDVRYDTADLPFSFVCLQDRAAGRCLDEASHYMAYPIWDWTEGDVVAQRYEVSVPEYMPPQTTYFHIGMNDRGGEISYADERRAGAQLLAGPVEVVGTASVDSRWKADTPIFNQELALLDHGMPAELAPGSTLEVSLEWQAVKSPARDYVVCLELRDRATGDLAVSFEELVGTDRHPTSRWVSGEPVYTFHKTQIPPDLGNGEFDLYLVLSDSAGRQVSHDPLLLGALSVAGRPHNFELPAPEHPLSADFGSSIRLLGFDLKKVVPQPGGEIEVVLYWQALDTVSEDYKVFVHLYHPFIPGGLPGQHDSSPGNGAFPTSSWLPGEVVTDSHLVEIEPEADVGLSQIGVGLYLPSTGERLPVSVGGQPQPDDALIITEVEITQN
jgi:4-amino-4-deoxy-L-arabinose transferase-like glycosyltransferase